MRREGYQYKKFYSMNSGEKSCFILSICIPVFNRDIHLLIGKLIEEISAKKYQEYIELIVMDDFSSRTELKYANHQFILEQKSINLHYIELEQNVGRSKIRNLLAEKASGKFLLFLDSDVLPDQTDFVKKYLDYATENKWDVICGGLSYKNRTVTGKEYDFYFYFGSRAEAKSVEARGRIPWRYVWTSNVMVRKSVFLQTSFDERFVGYGYEDSEWGIRLTKEYKVLHIDNTVSHLGLVTKETVYQKMRDSIGSYMLLAKLHPEAFRESSIHNISKWIVFLNNQLLEIADTVLKKMFFSINSNSLCFLIFQLNKAVLFAKQAKNQNP
ncbi:MAG: hypothetical protein A2042_03115 [Candidatus Schekmanbacteria bacterium GWA2_38_11]|uniref:Glycosyltransferase 2-like domain-containing protein n=1 Tax=Candidatus Schekmanbacteria bacterium GWA2_38_11 TaxID=1817876 RepID=A0A1F7RNB3_9BACT|nr:MAG: hypothetical protein A2042_03115 [Candidatus Schekmanbacteria bacterium GWA2_38_11]